MMTNAALSLRRATEPSAPPQDNLTLVELTWIAKKIENWIRFGQYTYEHALDRRRRLVGFPPGHVFAFVRWASNDFGTIISRIDIVRTVHHGEPYQTLPFVRPGGEILLKVEGWPKVERVLKIIDAIEALRIDPAETSPDHWRHVHNRMAAGQEPRAYSAVQHQTYLKRRSVEL